MVEKFIVTNDANSFFDVIDILNQDDLICGHAVFRGASNSKDYDLKPNFGRLDNSIFEKAGSRDKYELDIFEKFKLRAVSQLNFKPSNDW